jgi:protein phosphatase
VGRRANNEDAVFVSSRLLAVADGVGGSAAGEVASRLVIDALAHLDKRRLTGSLEEELQQAVGAGNDGVAFVASCRPELSGMGTTLTAVALSEDGDYLVANVGDSRTYLYRDGVLRRLTRDASLVQSLIDAGVLTEDQARDHPQRSVVLEALDGTPRTAVVIARESAHAGDRLLLCSDGLTDAVTDESIAAMLAQRDAEAVAEQLVDQALQAGSRDNVSVVVADVEPRRDGSTGWSGVPAMPVQT